MAIIGVVIWAWKAGDKTDHPGKENTTNKVTMIDHPLYSRHVEFPDNPLIVKLKTLNGVLVSQLNIVIMIDRPLFPDDQLSANLKNLNSVLVLQPAVRHVIVWAKAKAHHHR